MTTGQVDLASRPPSAYRDARIACLKEERGLAAVFIRNLFSVLYEVYSSSAGPAVRYKCLKALLRMVYYASADLLKEVLKNQIVSSHIAGMMASNDLRIVVGALQMAEILMQKLPEVFGVHFRREGVMHQMNSLADPANPICANTAASPKQTTTPSPGSLSAPASASCGQANPSFSFDAQATASGSASTVEGAASVKMSHVKNLANTMIITPKLSLSPMPSTSSNYDPSQAGGFPVANLMTVQQQQMQPQTYKGTVPMLSTFATGLVPTTAQVTTGKQQLQQQPHLHTTTTHPHHLHHQQQQPPPPSQSKGHHPSSSSSLHAQLLTSTPTSMFSTIYSAPPGGMTSTPLTGGGVAPGGSAGVGGALKAQGNSYHPQSIQYHHVHGAHHPSVVVTTNPNSHASAGNHYQLTTIGQHPLQFHPQSVAHSGPHAGVGAHQTSLTGASTTAATYVQPQLMSVVGHGAAAAAHTSQYYPTEMLNLTDSGIDRSALSLNTSSSLGTSPIVLAPGGHQLQTHSYLGGTPTASIIAPGAPPGLVALATAPLATAENMTIQPNVCTTAAPSSSGHSKMSEILKRKVPPKRKSQGGNRSKSKNDSTGQQPDATTSSAGGSSSSSTSVMQELINKATNLGSSSSSSTTGGARGSSSNSTPRSRFGANPTKGFLASLNPARWGRHSSSSSASSSSSSTAAAAAGSSGYTKEGGAANPFGKYPSNSNLLVAANREKARQWVRDQSTLFLGQHGMAAEAEGQQGGAMVSGTDVLGRLSDVIRRLGGQSNEILDALFELRNILMESDISPFEVNHSGLIKAMLNFMAVEDGPVPRNDRLRAFMHVFADLPIDEK